MISFAEESAERVEAETKAAREAEAAAEAARAAEAPEAAATTEQIVTATPSGKPTLESLFGPDTGKPEEQTLTAAQVFGDDPPQPTQPEQNGEQSGQ